jgi:glutamine synthetase
MAALLACGIDGLRRTIKIPPPMDVDPSTLDEQARRAKHVRLLPTSMEDRKAFVVGGEIGKPIRDFFGQRNVEQYFNSIVQGQEAASDMPIEDEIKQNICLY